MRAIVFPVVGPTNICSPFGDPRGEGRTHHGIDICAPMSTPILAPDSGDVRYGEDPMGGHVALVDGDGGGTWYIAHMSAFNGENRPVEAGDVIGFVGMSGNAATTLPHAHVEAWPTGVYTSYIDPTPLIVVAQHFKSPPTGSVAPLSRGKQVVLAAGVVALAVAIAYAMRLPSQPARTRRA